MTTDDVAFNTVARLIRQVGRYETTTSLLV